MTIEKANAYPIAAVCEAFAGRLKIRHGGKVIADTARGYRVIERRHPPTYYFPADDVDIALFHRNAHQTFCEWKGVATYLDFIPGGVKISNAAWFYEDPSPTFKEIKHYLSFYPSKFEHCFVNGEKVLAQGGDFYGGWITLDVEGPFKA